MSQSSYPPPPFCASLSAQNEWSSPRPFVLPPEAENDNWRALRLAKGFVAFQYGDVYGENLNQRPFVRKVPGTRGHWEALVLVHGTPTMIVGRRTFVLAETRRHGAHRISGVLIGSRIGGLRETRRQKLARVRAERPFIRQVK